MRMAALSYRAVEKIDIQKLRTISDTFFLQIAPISVYSFYKKCILRFDICFIHSPVIQTGFKGSLNKLTVLSISEGGR